MNLIQKSRLIRYALIPLLSFALLLAPLAPMSLLGLLLGTEMANAAPTTPKQENTKKFPNRPAKGQKTEIPEWRTANSKHFIKDDGYFEVEVSKESIFYKEKGTKKWLEIDNDLQVTAANGLGYKNKANRFEAQFASQAGNGSITALNLENASLKIVPLGIAQGAGKVKDNTITYANAYQSADLVYTVKSDEVKEEIVLKKANAPSAYLFELKLDNLKYVSKENGEIEFQYADTSAFAFRIPKPFMYEGGDIPESKDVKEHSDNVTQTIREEGGKLLLELKADQAWLNAPDRQFPVIIDPTEDMKKTEKYMKDTFASKSYPTQTAYAGYSHMYAGTTPDYGEAEAFISFPLPSLPDGSIITNGQMKLYNYLSKTKSTVVDVYNNTSWPSTAISWNNKPGRGEKVTSGSVAAAGWVTFDIKQLTKDWYTGKKPNKGVSLVANPGTSEGVGFTAVEHASDAYRPVLSIEYWNDPEGDNNFWTYTADGVMPYKGNLYLDTIDIGTPGRGVDATINRSYNSRQTVASGVFGPNWLSALDMRVWDLGGSVAFLDAHGTRHLFARTDSGYVAPAGISLGLINQNNQWEVKTMANTKYFFDTTHSMLRTITDPNGQTTTFTYDTGDRNWTKLTILDPSGRDTTVTRVNGKVSVVQDKSGRQALYGYDATTGMLSSVTIKKDAETATHGYSYTPARFNPGNYLLTTITDPKGYVTNYLFDIYDRVNEVNRTVDGVKSATTYTYDTSVSPRKVTVKGGDCVTSANQFACEETRYYVNDNGNMEKKEDVISVTNGIATLATTKYAWSSKNHLFEVTSPNHVKAGETDKHTTRVQYNEAGEPQKVTTPDGKEVLLNYNTNNDLISVKDPMNSVSGVNYNQNHNPVDLTDSVGNTTMLDYDQYGNLTSATQPMSLAENFVRNSGFETDRGYDTIPYSWGYPSIESGEIFAVDSATQLSGYSSVHVKSAGADGFTGSMNGAIPVQSKLAYNLTAALKVKANSTAELRVTFKNSSGTVLSQMNGLLQTKAGTTDRDWVQKSSLIEAPDGAVKAELALFVNGEAWADNLIFEGGTGRSGNLMNHNYSFEHDYDKTSLADGWYPYDANDKTISIWYADKIHGLASERMQGDPLKDKYVEQKLIVSGSKGAKFNLSGWAKQTGASATGEWEMRLVFYKPDGTTQIGGELPFATGTAGWQQQSGVITAPVDFKEIGIRLAFSKMPTTAYAYFDDVRFSILNTNSSTISQYNQIDNTSFEYNDDSSVYPDGWLPKDGMGSKVEHVGTPNVYTGEKALKITADPAKNVDVELEFQDIKIDGTKTYTLVGYVKTNLTSGNALLYAKGWHDTFADPISTLETELVSGKSDWKRVSMVISPNTFSSEAPPADRMKIGVRVQPGAGVVYFDNVRLQEGDFSTKIWYDAKSNYVSSVQNPLNHTTWVETDENTGYVQEVKNHFKQKFRFDYDFMGQIKAFYFPYQDLPGNPTVEKSFQYDYDANGNLRTVTDPYNKSWANYEYNELNRVKSFTETVTLNGVTSSNVWSYQYNELGNLRLVVSPRKTFTDFAYDYSGRLTKYTFGNYDVGSPTGYSFTYDLNGNLTGSGFGKPGDPAWAPTALTYDNMNRLTKMSEVTSANSVENAYDDAGRRTKATVRSSDGAMWWTEFLYDSQGTPKGLKDITGREAWFLFDEAGRKVKTYNSNQTETFFDRDAAGRMSEVIFEKAGLPLQQLNYKYNELGYVTEQSTLQNGVSSSVLYEYDPSGQLIKETYSDNTVIEYQYDLLGNRVKMIKNGSETLYTYNPERNRLVAAGNKAYQYDLDGNVVSDGTFTYEWDDQNKIGEVRGVADDKITRLYYDELGRRTGFSTGDSSTPVISSTEYHLDGEVVAYIKKKTGTVTEITRFTYDHGDHPLFMTYKGQQYWYHYDKDGSVQFLTDATGSKVAEYKYDAWGNTTPVNLMSAGQPNISKINPYRYRGYWYDEEIQKYYLQARYYDPSIGRFLSKDVVNTVVGDKLGMNSYVYGANNPVTFSDPAGTYFSDGEVVNEQKSHDYVHKNPGGPVNSSKSVTQKKSNTKEMVKMGIGATKAATGAIAGSLGSKAGGVADVIGSAGEMSDISALPQAATGINASLDMSGASSLPNPGNMIQKVSGAFNSVAGVAGGVMNIVDAYDDLEDNDRNSVLGGWNKVGASMKWLTGVVGIMAVMAGVAALPALALGLTLFAFGTTVGYMMVDANYNIRKGRK